MSSNYEHLLTPSYKITKAALNMMTVQYALTYAQEGFTFLAISPGVSIFYCTNSRDMILQDTS